MATPLISYLHFTDGKINRASHEGPYRIGKGMPMNVRGRTGMEGRGVLGRYGPNHAADPIVTRWKRDEIFGFCFWKTSCRCAHWIQGL